MAFLGNVGGKKGQCMWSTDSFKINMGAEISHKQYRKMKINVTLTKVLYGPANQSLPVLEEFVSTLYGPANQSLPVLGEFVGTLRVRGKCCSQRIFVVTGLRNNLLGLPAIDALGLVVRMDVVMGDYKGKISVLVPRSRGDGRTLQDSSET